MMPQAHLIDRSGPRRFIFAALYLSEGAPIGFIWWFLPTELRTAGVPVEKITALTALLVLPWTIKFFWAPLVDSLRGKRWGHRAWIVTAQILMGLTLLPLAVLDLQTQFAFAYVLLLAHALAAATQDVAIDAWAIHVTPDSERGRISGWMQAGMLTGRWLFGAGPLMLEQTLGLPIVIPILVGVIWVTSVLLIFAGPGIMRAPVIHVRHFFSALGSLLARRQTWLGLALALLAGAGFEAVGAVAGPLLVDRGLSKPQIAWFYSASVVAMLLGALAGGFSADRLGRRISAFIFIVLLSMIIAAIAAADHQATLLGFMIAMYAGIGLLTAATYAIFMDLTDPRLGGTQFSAYMAGTNACEAWATFSVGRLIASFGYPPAFLILAGCSLLALPLLAKLQVWHHRRHQIPVDQIAR